MQEFQDTSHSTHKHSSQRKICIGFLMQNRVQHGHRKKELISHLVSFLLVPCFILLLLTERKNTWNLKNSPEHFFVRIKSGIRIQCSVKARDELQEGIIMVPAGGVAVACGCAVPPLLLSKTPRHLNNPNCLPNPYQRQTHSIILVTYYSRQHP